MKVTIEVKTGFLVATVSGTLKFSTALELFKQATDAAEERGLKKILFDWLGVEAALSTPERFLLATEMLAYFQTHRSNPQIVLVGVPPTIDGFGALVYQNRGGNIKVFSNLKEAEDWLKQC